ncbi:PIN-like domain-containing protein [Nocardia fusca]|uniref:PIN-like domain-containing protein n=1 Tax=Nocardia fusca TaxID=941183 RepID=UPI0037A965FA
MGYPPRAHIPPGYEDAKKGGRSSGDYLVWHQTRAGDAERFPAAGVTVRRRPLFAWG